MSTLTKQRLLDQVLDLVGKIETDDGFKPHKSSMEDVGKFRADYNGSSLDLFLVADRLKKIGEELLTDELKENAHEEFKLRHGDEKAEHKGNSMTPVESHFRYNYPEDKFLTKYEEEASEIKEQMKPYKDQLSTIKDSVKKREKELEKEGKATLKSKSTYLRVDRK